MRKEGDYAITADELEAMRLADEEIEREFEESYSAQYTDAEISKWLDDLAAMIHWIISSYITNGIGVPTVRRTRIRSQPSGVPTTKSTRTRSVHTNEPISASTVSGNASKKT